MLPFISSFFVTLFSLWNLVRPSLFPRWRHMPHTSLFISYITLFLFALWTYSAVLLLRSGQLVPFAERIWFSHVSTVCGNSCTLLLLLRTNFRLVFQCVYAISAFVTKWMWMNKESSESNSFTRNIILLIFYWESLLFTPRVSSPLW